MSAKLPVIVGFGGFNAAGRSSGHQAYRRMILESLSDAERQNTLSGLSRMMGGASESDALNGTLVRRIERAHFDADNANLTRKFVLDADDSRQISFVASRRELPSQLPAHWHSEPLDEEGKRFRVTIAAQQDVKIDTCEPIAVQSAGQLPTGFDPSEHYRSLHHPRGLQMAIMGASDAVKSVGIDWQHIVSQVSADQISVYSASLMSQLDSKGFGGLFDGRSNGLRTSSKQVALGLNTMPADFINAYVLGSMGATGGTAGACATFLYNLRQGAEDIRSGRRLVSLVGASEAPLLPEIIDGYGAMGALASDAELRKLDGTDFTDHRRASRPFGENCGFTLAESCQYFMLMSEELALSLGAKIYGAVPAVYVNADGFKKSISAPGAGNYITLAKSVGLARTLLGDEAIQRRSVIQAHGSSTPQNRITESRIFDQIADVFGVNRWPVAAIKSYVGHSLAAASGDQLSASLGIFNHGILPGIKTHSEVASDVYDDRLMIPTEDLDLGKGNTDAIFLNSKGFGGNNATATVFSPTVVDRYLEKKYGEHKFREYLTKRERTSVMVDDYLAQADRGEFQPIYQFGRQLVDESQIEITTNTMRIPGFAHDICLENREGFSDF